LKYYPDYIIRTVPHDPWQIPPIHLPAAKRATIMEMLEDQRSAGKYELCASSYRSAFFTVEKKGGLLRIVHDLQPLNRVTIRDASLPPRVDEMIEKFKGYAFYFITDLKSGYDAVVLAQESRDLTAFHAYDFGLMRLTSLPQGFTNSMSVFCCHTGHMMHALTIEMAREWKHIRSTRQNEDKKVADANIVNSPDLTDTVIRPTANIETKADTGVIESGDPGQAEAFVDDCIAAGCRSRYDEEPISGNLQIRRFIYEGVGIFKRFCICAKEAGVTVSGDKLVAATPELEMVGAVVSLLGAHITRGTLTKIENWPICTSVTEVRGFLGTVGVVRRWIKDFSKIAAPLTVLTTKTENPEFMWTNEAQDAMERLKLLAVTAPPLTAINYEPASKIIQKEFRTSDEGLVILAVDSLYIGARWIVSQIRNNQELPILFGSTTFNPRESKYSQPKLELYGLYRAVKAERHRLYGVFT